MTIAIVIEDVYDQAVIAHVDEKDLRSIIVCLDNIEELTNVRVRDKAGNDTLLFMEDYNK